MIGLHVFDDGVDISKDPMAILVVLGVERVGRRMGLQCHVTFLKKWKNRRKDISNESSCSADNRRY